VDIKVIELLSYYDRSYSCLSDHQKRNRVVLLLSGDKDYSSSVRALRQSDHTVMIIWNHDLVNAAYLSHVREEFRLGKWNDFCHFHNPPAIARADMVPAPLVVGTLRPQDASHVYAFVEFILLKNEQPSGNPKVLASKVTELYEMSPALKSVVTELGLKKFCLLSSECVQYETLDKIGWISVCAWAMLRFFVKEKGGTLTGNLVGELYSRFGKASSRFKELVKAEGKLAGLCQKSNGSMTWTRVEDESIGYGYVTVNSDAIPACPNLGPAASSNRLYAITVPWFQYNYVNSFLKDELDQEILKISPNVVMSIFKPTPPANPEFHFSYTSQPVEESKSPRNEIENISEESCLKACHALVSDVLKSIKRSDTRVFSISRETLLEDLDLKAWRARYQLNWSVKVSGDNPVVDESNVLFMKLPENWLTAARSQNDRNQGEVRGCVGGRNRGGRGRNPGRSNSKRPPTLSIEKYLREEILQHLLNYFSLNQSVYDIIRLAPEHATPHIKLKLNKNSDKNRLLSTKINLSTRIGATFHTTLESQDNIETIQSTSVICYYCTRFTQPAAIDEFWSTVAKLQNKIEIIDLFPDPENQPPNQFRSQKEQYFFNEWTWNYFQSEVERLAPGVVLNLQRSNETELQKRKTLIQVKGLESEVDAAVRHLRDRSTSLLWKNFKIKQEQQSYELTTAIRSALKSLRQHDFEKRKNQLETQLGIQSNDNTSEDGSVVSESTGVTTRHLYPRAHIGKTHVEIVGIPESHDFWQLQCEAILELIRHFTTTKVVVDSANVKPISLCSKISKTFFGVKAHYEANEKSITLSGVSDRVQNAVSFLQQKIAGEATSIILVRSLTYSPLITSRYFSLPKANNLLAGVRDDLVRMFESAGRITVSAAITLDTRMGGTLLTLQCPDRLAQVATQEANSRISELVGQLKLHSLPKSEKVLKWLKQTGVTSINQEALININMTPTDETIDCLVPSTECYLANVKVFVLCCDFSDLLSSDHGCDCVVNSANSTLQHGSGIARTIADSAGPCFQTECERGLIANNGVVPIGAAIATDGCDLRKSGITTVIHCVAPVYNANSESQLKFQFRSAIRSALTAVQQQGCRCVAIPGIGTGIFGWPIEIATREIVFALSEWIALEPQTSIESIILFDIEEKVTRALDTVLHNFADGRIVPEAPKSNTALNPLQFMVPTHQWFRFLWNWEIKDNSPVTELTFDSGKFMVCPFDYDQVVELERGYLSGIEGLSLIGDSNGQRNNKSYDISFPNMTQTTNPVFNAHSTRKIFRVPLLPGQEATIPLYNERYSQHLASISAYDSEQSQKQPSALVTPTHFIEESSSSTGLTIFGLEEDVNTTISLIDTLIHDHLNSEVVRLELLSRYASVTFASILPNLIAELRNLDVEIISTDPSLWEISIEALGWIALVEAKNLILSIEKRLLNEALRTPYPESWHYDADLENHAEPTIEPLDELDPEYLEAKDCFLLKGFQAHIHRIERIQNPELYEKYHKKRCEISRLNSGNPNELLLKHGTKSLSPDVIWKSSPSKSNTYAFDFRHSSESNYYGRGSYFTDDARYVNGGYAYRLPGSQPPMKQMFLAWVAAGSHDEKTAVDRDLRMPGAGFHSVRGPVTSTQMGVIVYELSQSYPAYLVTYSD
jgi:O-acetyl-ADP-ribose deacetylase